MRADHQHRNRLKRQFWWPMAKRARLHCCRSSGGRPRSSGSTRSTGPHIPESRCKLGFAREPARGFPRPTQQSARELRLRPPKRRTRTRAEAGAIAPGAPLSPSQRPAVRAPARADQRARRTGREPIAVQGAKPPLVARENTSHLVDLDGQKVAIFALIAIANATRLIPTRAQRGHRAPRRPIAQRTMDSASGSSRSRPQSNCPRHHETYTDRSVYKQPENQMGIGHSGRTGPNEDQGFAMRASAAARGMPKATDPNVAFLKRP